MSEPLELPMLTAADVEALLTRAEAASAVAEALVHGLEPGSDPNRIAVPLRSGQFLLMPSESDSAVGLKAATVAPTNPDRGLPRIQAAYLLFDASTLALRAVIDGTAITNLRTPAVSIAAVTPLLERFHGPVRVLLFGAGPQAVGHLAALEDSASVAVEKAAFVVRNADRARATLPSGSDVLRSTDPRLAELIADADIIVCATSTHEPLFDSTLVKQGAIVIAVGSHEPNHRELDANLMGRSDVIVDDISTALREAGDVVMAIEEGTLAKEDLIPMTEVIRGQRALKATRVVVFRSTGMSWQDLVTAEAIMRRYDTPASPESALAPGGGTPEFLAN